MKKKVSTLNAPFVIVWNKNFFSTTLRYSMLSEYLKITMHVWPRMTQAMEMARNPWTVLIVSLPTPGSQMVFIFSRTEKDNSNSSQTSGIEISIFQMKKTISIIYLGYLTLIEFMEIKLTELLYRRFSGWNTALTIIIIVDGCNNDGTDWFSYWNRHVDLTFKIYLTQ